MATKRRPLHGNSSTPSGHMNFRPTPTDSTQRPEVRGTRPTATPTSVREVMIMMIMHICKKTIFFDVNLKVALYLGSLFLISLIGDFVPYPKSYFSRSDNIFNVYFVKMGWAWTLSVSVPFLVLTSYTISCGNGRRVLTNHAPRIVIATAFWFIWTKSFNLIESTYGRCMVRQFDSKSACLKAGHLWNGFDLSGHAFILIYSSLVLIEEARPIIGWENIRTYLRNEEHNRTVRDTTITNPLRHLNDHQIKVLKHLYEKYTPIIRGLFIGMTVLQLLWDIMLVCTMLYYHRMIEKVLSGIFAILTWFFTYRAWYPSSVLPDPVGQGSFVYNRVKTVPTIPLRRQSSLYNPTAKDTVNDIPKFMGMPLYNMYNQTTAKQTRTPGDTLSGNSNVPQPSTFSGSGFSKSFERL